MTATQPKLAIVVISDFPQPGTLLSIRDAGGSREDRQIPPVHRVKFILGSC